jgi:hypothetical protein
MQIQTDSESETASAKRSRFAQWSSLVAFGISALALGLSVYQTRLMQTQARASVWPYLDIGFGYDDKGEGAGFELHVQNNGVGPALVRSVQVSFDDKPMHHWSDVISVVMNEQNKHGTSHSKLAGLHNVVIPPSLNRETDVVAIRIEEPDVAKAVYDARDRLKMDICYCSIYNDCWTVQWHMTLPVEAPSCRESKNEFDY